MKNFIVVEGIDGSGKSTLCNFISKNFGYLKLKSPEGIFGLAGKNFNTNSVSIQERFSFYAGSNINSSMKISKLLSQGKKIVIDRYFYSTIVYHEVASPGVTQQVIPIFENLLQPDLIFYLNTNLQTIQNRLKNRKKTRNDKKYLTLENHSKIDIEYRKVLGSKFVEVNNDLELEVMQSFVTNIMNSK